MSPSCNFGGHQCCGSGDIMFLTCHLTSQHHVALQVGKPYTLTHLSTTFGGFRDCGSSDTMALIVEVQYPKLSHNASSTISPWSTSHVMLSHTKCQINQTFSTQCLHWNNSDTGHIRLQEQWMKRRKRLLSVRPKRLARWRKRKLCNCKTYCVTR